MNDRCMACKFRTDTLCGIEIKGEIDHWVCETCYFRTLAYRKKLALGYKSDMVDYEYESESIASSD